MYSLRRVVVAATGVSRLDEVFMKKLVHGHCVHLSFVALGALALLIGGCAASTAGSGGSGGGSGAGTNGTGSGGGGAGTPGTGGGGAGTSGTGAGGAGTSGTGGNGTGGTGPTTSGTGGTGPSGADASAPGTGGGSAGTSGGVARTTELIGPGGATCAARRTPLPWRRLHLHPQLPANPARGPNVVGYWFDYAFVTGTCNVAFTKPAGNSATNPQVCFSGSACPATSGGGLGLALCDTHGIDVSTWPELSMLETTSSLSSTAKSPFNGCNPGATITSVSWTLGSGSIPAGTSVLFDDAADVNVTRIDNVAAGATSVAVPANVDTSKVASIKFSLSGGSNTSWNFCLTSLKVSSTPSS